MLYLFLLRLLAAIRADLQAARQPRRRPAGAGESARSAPPGRLIVLDGESANLQRGSSLALAEVTNLGRSADCDVRLDDPQISSRHARLRWRGGRWHVADLQSTNGTLLNRQSVLGEQPMEFGDVLQVGDVLMKLAQ